MKTFALIFVLLAASLHAYTVDGTTVTTNGTQSDTQSAITYVDGLDTDGYTIVIGSAGGDYTWTSGVSMASTFVHSVTIQSAGGTGNKTTIRGSFSGSQAIGIRATPNKITKVQNFIFDGTDGTFGSGFIAIDQTSTSDASNSFWIENCDFIECDAFAIKVLDDNRTSSGMVWGLIDLCTFSTTGSNNGVYVFGGEDGDMWDGSMTWGTVNTVTIEDNTFTKTGLTVEGNPAIDSAYFGASWLARHNTFTNWVCVAHGADSAPTSTLQVEFYTNTINLTANDAVDYVLYLRGGAAIVTDNTLSLSGGASVNSFVKFAQDSSPPDFQQVGDGAVAGVETIVGAYIYSNSAAGAGQLVANAGTLAQNTNWFLSAPGPGLPTTSYTPLVYPHPLRGAGAGGGSATTGAVTFTGSVNRK